MGEKDPPRRTSDDTRARIDQLAGGWDVPARERTPEDEPAPAAKLPPPPPAPRVKGPTRPPPPPPAALARPPAPPPAPPRAAEASIAAPDPHAPPEDDSDAAAETLPRPKRGTAEPPAAAKPARPIVIEAGGGREGDATRVDKAKGDATILAERAAAAAVGTLRAPASFRKRRGWAGDVLYVGTVLFGGASARRELARLEQAIERGREARRGRLIALGADGVGEPSLDDPRVEEAREALAQIEEDRSERAGQAAAAEADVAAIQRSERGEVERRTQEVKDLEAELAKIGARLAPLEKEAQAIRKRGGELRATLAGLDDRIRETEASLVSVRGGKVERAGVEAELATLRADRVAVARDEPALAAQLDAISPRIASLEAERTRANEKLAEARAAIGAAAERATDELGAVQAAKRVIDRGLGDLEKRRDRALAALGEHFAIERPAALAVPLAALDEADLAIATDERRAMEVREMLGSVDRGAFARGMLVLLLVAGAIAAFAWFVATRR